MILRTKNVIKAMKFKCPFCGRAMVFIDDDWTDSKQVNGKWHDVRKLVFEHEPWVEDECRGGSLIYYFIESNKDPEKQVPIEVDIE